MLVLFYNFYCILFGEYFYIDIYLVFFMIEVLNIVGYEVGVMRLIVVLFFVFVVFYKSFFFGFCDVSLLFIFVRCFLGIVYKIGLKFEENGELLMEFEIFYEKVSNGFVWLEDIILFILIFVYLY